MGGRSNKSSGGGSYTPVAKTTQGQANSAVSKMADSQSSWIGEVLGPLLQQGQSVMDNNPGMSKFMSDVGQKKEAMDDFFTGPGSILAKLDEAFGVEREGATPVEQPPQVNGLTDEQMEQIRRSGYGSNFNINTPYSINDDMRNRFNR